MRARGITAWPDHPRERGDDILPGLPRPIDEGPPPRARGRLAAAGALAARRGTTPASAGTTTTTFSPLRWTRDHPRERGDDPSDAQLIEARQGPPPRARGRPAVAEPGRRAGWTTPASAGTTSSHRTGCRARPDHPRERGDDPWTSATSCSSSGPPPRARGRHRTRRCRGGPDGTTPASAGTTRRFATRLSQGWDHPRERGDDATVALRRRRCGGPPPRARGRPLPGPPRRTRSGTTPASAGTTSVCAQVASRIADHPRRARGRPAPLVRFTRGQLDHPRERGDDSLPKATPCR